MSFSFLTGANTIDGYVFDGAYSINIAPVDANLVSFWTGLGINPTGITGNPVYYSSGAQNIDQGYFATGIGSNTVISSGATNQNTTSSSGYLYYNISTPIYGVCHGTKQDQNTWFSGYSYYNGFHPAGYIAPPYGENISLYFANQDGFQALQENGSCATLTNSEYNDIFGIVSTTDAGILTVTADDNASANGFINSPSIECPVDVGLNYYWNESQLKLIAGTASAITANTFFNTNPIPTSLDMFDLRTTILSGRYAATTTTTSGVNTYTIQYDNSGKPIPSYPRSGGSNVLNSQVCFAIAAGSSLFNGVSVESDLMDVPDSTITAGSQSAVAAAGAYFDPFNWWNLEQFLFKENSDGFPFTNSFQTLGDGQVTSAQSDVFGSQLFNFQLADSDSYWENRQCPNVVDFLPHTIGASIFACPSYYFDAPYYAVTKKFGFYGARFLNGCLSLGLQYAASGQSGSQNAVELSSGIQFVSDTEADGEPNTDKWNNWNFTLYDNLLGVATAEENQSDFYALNIPLFLWFNYPIITGSSTYQNLISGNSGFIGTLSSLLSDYVAAFPSGKNSLLNTNYLFESGNSYIMYDTGKSFPILSNNDEFVNFQSILQTSITGDNSFYWQSLINTYGNAILTSSGTVDTGFYYSLQTGRNARFLTRYLENYVRGNPVDLYPTNKIWFGTDQARSVIDSSDWGKSTKGFDDPAEFTFFNDSKLNRRYFLGAYGNGNNISGYLNYINNISNLSSNSFYPGYFNNQIGLQLPQPAYFSVITGNIYSGGQNVTDTTITNGINPLPQGWLGVGYNGIGQLKGNFSCFTPIFIQQPLPTVFCKIGDSPTFRSYAVDYHTIPEDKINIRYPEIVYWTQKLKTIDQNYNNKYPLSYSWFRLNTGLCSGNFQNFLLNPDFSLLEPANTTGTWACLESNGPFCTLIHAQDCIPPYTNSGTWNYDEIGTVPYQYAQTNNFYMTFKKGADTSSYVYGDDEYFYFCIVTGRFGVRISEPSQLFIEDWLQFDISIQNGANVSLDLPITFTDSDNPSNSITISATSAAQNYEGFERDNDAIPESIIQEKIPPPDAGFGDAYSYQFVGPWGYKGALQAYTPGTLNDTRGLMETWNRMVDYGSLTHYFTNLTQKQGDFLYGFSHLPTCTDTWKNGQISGSMASGQKGIKVNIPGIVHWSNMQTPVVSTDGNYGVLWSELGNAGELYTASNQFGYALDEGISPGLGQWQFGNNLGTIHIFGPNSQLTDISSSPQKLTPSDLIELKSGLFKNGALGGSDCGWNQCGLGRNTTYFIEGFDSYYLYCDSIKKKNVQNTNYMNPGLRSANSSIQYFWLGKPNNTYVKRYPMFGPYAYQWKVSKHNRDRNGNGMSQGFYSYGWNVNYSLMYDIPAIYGLVRKTPNQNTELVNQINNLRNTAFNGAENTIPIPQWSFGFTYSGQESVNYGTIFIGPIDNQPQTPYQAYVNTGAVLASNVSFNDYTCSDDDLNNGECFDPCISIRYANGFLPGGKVQDLFTSFPEESDGDGYNIVANNIFINNNPTNFYTSTVTGAEEVYFRGPFGTPHFKFLSSQGYTLNGFSTCADGGADHCNYITATLNIGTSVYYQAQGPSFITAVNEATQSVDYSLPSNIIT